MRADLQEVYGVDVAEWFTAKRWAALHDLIEELPRASRTKQALLTDPENGRVLYEARERAKTQTGSKWSPELREFDTPTALLMQIVDLLKVLQSTTVAANGGKPKKFDALSHPRDAGDEYKTTLHKNKQNELLNRFGGHLAK